MATNNRQKRTGYFTAADVERMLTPSRGSQGSAPVEKKSEPAAGSSRASGQSSRPEVARPAAQTAGRKMGTFTAADVESMLKNMPSSTGASGGQTFKASKQTAGGKTGTFTAADVESMLKNMPSSTSTRTGNRQTLGAPAAKVMRKGGNLPDPHPSAQSADTFPQGGRQEGSIGQGIFGWWSEQRQHDRELDELYNQAAELRRSGTASGQELAAKDAEIDALLREWEQRDRPGFTDALKNTGERIGEDLGGVWDQMRGSLMTFKQTETDPEVWRARWYDWLAANQAQQAAQARQEGREDLAELQEDYMRQAAETDDTEVLTPETSRGMALQQQGRKRIGRATEGMNGLGRAAVDVGNSMLTNLPSMALGLIPVVGQAAGLGLMGAQAAGARTAELSGQGVRAGEASTRALLSGGIEVATEIIPVGNWSDIVKTGAGKTFLRRVMGEMVDKSGQAAMSGLERAARNILSQALSEGTEEAVSYIANYIADAAANDPNATFSLEELIESAALGAASGAGFGALGTGINAAGRALVGQQQAAQMQANGAVEQAAGEMQREAAEGVQGEQARQAALADAAQQQTALPDGEKEEELFRLFMGQPERAQDGAAAAANAVPAAQTQTETAQQQTALPDGEKAEELFRLFMSRPVTETAGGESLPAPRPSAQSAGAPVSMTNSGTVQAAPDVEQRRQLVAEFAAGMETYTDGMKQTVQAGYRGQDPVAYVQAVNGMYNAGRTGSLTWEQALAADRAAAREVDDPALLRRAFALGQQSVRGETAANAPLGTPARGGTVAYGEGVERGSTQMPAAVLDAFANKFGIDIDVVRQLTDGSGQKANASFAAGLARVALSENSKNGYQSLVHELTHYMDIANAEGWARLRGKVLAFYTSERGMDAAQQMLDRYGESYDGAAIGADELARDLWSGIFSGEENMRSFLEYISEDGSTAEKRTVLQTLRDILDKVIEYLRGLLRGGDATIGAAEGRRLAEQADTAQRCRELVDAFLRELETARQNAQTTVNTEQQQNNAADEMPAASEVIRFSIQVDDDGPFVEIDPEHKAFSGLAENDIKGRIKALRTYMRNTFQGNSYPIESEQIRVGRAGINEYLHPAARHGWQRGNFRQKLKAGTELDNLLAVSKFEKHVDNESGKHSEATGGWDYYQTRFRLQGRMYVGRVIVRITDNGKDFYDVTHIKETASLYRQRAQNG